jgi:hypothetical protein
MKRAFPAALAWLLPTVVAAQSVTMAPSFAASEMYDDNLFVSASDRQQTFVLRLGPRLTIERNTATLSLVGRYEIDAEYLQNLPNQELEFARQLGAFKLRHRPTKRLALKCDVEYLDTRNSVELFDTRNSVELGTVTPLDRGRVRARHFSVDPSLLYKLDRDTQVEFDYLFARDFIPKSTTDSHIAKAEVVYRFTRDDSGSAGVLLRQLVFNGDARMPSEVALFGWTHLFARRTSVSAHAGPRFRGVKPEGVEADATVRQGFDQTELEASYTRAETTTVGFPGSLQTDAADLSATLRFEPIVFQSSARFARTYGAGLQADVVYTLTKATAQVFTWLSAEISFSFTWQQLETRSSITNTVATPGGGGITRVFHDVVALTLVVMPPKPLEL